MQTNSKKIDKLDKLETKTRKLEKKSRKKLESAQSNCWISNTRMFYYNTPNLGLNPSRHRRLIISYVAIPADVGQIITM